MSRMVNIRSESKEEGEGSGEVAAAADAASSLLSRTTGRGAGTGGSSFSFPLCLLLVLLIVKERLRLAGNEVGGVDELAIERRLVGVGDVGEVGVSGGAGCCCRCCCSDPVNMAWRLFLLNNFFAVESAVLGRLNDNDNLFDSFFTVKVELALEAACGLASLLALLLGADDGSLNTDPSLRKVGWSHGFASRSQFIFNALAGLARPESNANSRRVWRGSVAVLGRLVLIGGLDEDAGDTGPVAAVVVVLAAAAAPSERAAPFRLDGFNEPLAWKLVTDSTGLETGVLIFVKSTAALAVAGRFRLAFFPLTPTTPPTTAPVRLFKLLFFGLPLAPSPVL